MHKMRKHINDHLKKRVVTLDEGEHCHRFC